ncbi:MAG: phage major capsid protein [Actinomycetota bacterium]|nr:phage major capsid protein [Actinomycetota bacterium]
MPSSTVNQPELTADQVQRILVKPLEQASVFLAAGPRIFDVTAAGPVRIPKLVSMGAPAWHGENELITEVDPDFGEVRLLDGVKSVKSITRFSNELARSSVVALDAALRDKMVLDVAAKIDQAFIAGTGDPVGGKNTTPLGILNYPGVQTIAGVGTPTLDDLLDAVALTYTANVDTGRLRWMMTSRDFITLRRLKDTTGKYLLQPDATQDAVFRLLGIPVTVTNRIPIVDDPATTTVTEALSTIVLADFSQIAVARDLAPSVRLLDQLYADFDQQAIRVVARYDAAPLNPAAVVLLKGVTA